LIKNINFNLSDVKMDLERLDMKVSKIAGIVKFICSRKTFSASEIVNKFNVANTTLYRYLLIWCNKSYITSRKNNNGNHNGALKEFKVTPKGLLVYTEFYSKYYK